MAEPGYPGISARLWRLPGQLLLALINDTAILVIAASILAIVALVRIEHFAETIVATTTHAVLSKNRFAVERRAGEYTRIDWGSPRAW